MKVSEEELKEARQLMDDGRTPEMLIKRCRDYLASGGLWNPEMAIHLEVRNLIMDVLQYLEDEP